MENKTVEKTTIEEMFLRLNAIIADMDREDVTLEDSFSMYQEGIRLIKACNGKIDRVEKQLIVLNTSEEEQAGQDEGE